MKINKVNYKKPEKKIIIFTGAGLSAESGISTFRDSNGLWENHKIDDVCNESTWKSNFELVHKFYNQRRIQLNDVEPNEAHKTIKRIKDKYKDDCFVITQNVDDLLERSGIPEDEVLHLHGYLRELKCLSCGNITDIKYTEFDSLKGRCGNKNCNSHFGIRPNIVFFGGEAPMYKELYKAMDYLKNPETILIVIGTMGNVISISNFLGVESYSGNWKKTIENRTILNNKEYSKYLDERLFDTIYYENATMALPKIEKYLEKYF